MLILRHGSGLGRYRSDSLILVPAQISPGAPPDASPTPAGFFV